MTLPAVLITYGTIAAIVMIVGAVYKDQKFAPFAVGAGGIMLAILGVTMLVSPLEYSTGTVITETPTGYTVQPSTTPLSNNFNTSASLILAMGGVAAIAAGIGNYRGMKRELEDDGIDQLPRIS